MAKLKGLTFLIAGCVLLSGCSGDKSYNDLQNYMQEIKSRPVGEIEPLPTFRSHKTFRYGAIAMRSPFDAPLIAGSAESVAGKSTVEPPSENRKKEYLESFNFAALSMVGILSRKGQMWSLINDGSGGIHRVTVGNYLGKNYGRITAISNAKVDVIEIVPDGKGNWVERPRTLGLNEKD
ncbi:pilus assembly protein PilP [uncultured Porticoccus sp.]|uniref:pilus assembly protein PilP n=1 Tax=uncultured Porticoccus sp. TaxID=1256050 RepID=UPI0030D93ABF|tara:strand:- start:2686 stop:3222 length:537 start_codon:yes stop_codon:yes gene_type:complete